MSDSTSIRVDSSTLDGMIELFRGSRLSHGKIDVWCFYLPEKAKAAAAFAATAFFLEGRPFRRVAVVIPGDQNELAAFRAQLRAHFQDLLRTALPPEDVTSVLATLETRLQIEPIIPHTADAVVDAIKPLVVDSAILILDAGRFSSFEAEQVPAGEVRGPDPGRHLLFEEDLWVPRVLHVVERVRHVIEGTTSWAALVTGHDYPSRPENATALEAVPGSLIGVRPPEGRSTHLAGLQRWISLAVDGQLTAAFREIDASNLSIRPANSVLRAVDISMLIGAGATTKLRGES